MRIHKFIKNALRIYGWYPPFTKDWDNPWSTPICQTKLLLSKIPEKLVVVLQRLSHCLPQKWRFSALFHFLFGTASVCFMQASWCGIFRIYWAQSQVHVTFGPCLVTQMNLGENEHFKLLQFGENNLSLNGCEYDFGTNQAIYRTNTLEQKS